MIPNITIKNFKSIADDTIELGRVNVFIGENGCGKSNILEAVAFASTAIISNDINKNILAGKGVRIAKPSLMVNSFKGKKQNTTISIDLKTERDSFSIKLTADNDDIHHAKWLRNNERTPGFHLEIDLFQFLIYSLNTPALRGMTHESKEDPLGIYGEKLDMLIANFGTKEREMLKKYSYMIEWLDDFLIDTNDVLKLKGFKQNLSQSRLYFSDKFMSKQNNIFSSENANEGILHVLFYLAAMISEDMPPFFAIDNIDACLNPHLCRELMSEICTLAKQENCDKQLLITTHNPAILDGLNLFDDEIRLFEVKRLENGNTKTRRIMLKPTIENDMGERYKLSELWTRGYLGAKPQNFYS